MILGLDISTIVCGICVLDLKGNIINVSHENFTADTLLLKSVEVRTLIKKLLSEYDINHFFVEDRLQGFAGGATNAEAMQKTAAINFYVQALMLEYGVTPVAINVNAARSICFPGFHKIARALKGVKQKETVFKMILASVDNKYFPTKVMKSGVRKGETVFINEAMDRADAIVIAQAGFKIFVNGK